MRSHSILVCAATLLACATASAQTSPVSPQPSDSVLPDSIRTLVGRLDLERYKATIKGLTQFGDRRQGTARNRAAIDWIEAQIKSYGCANTERLKYQHGEEGPHGVLQPPPYATGPIFNVGGARYRRIYQKLLKKD